MQAAVRNMESGNSPVLKEPAANNTDSHTGGASGGPVWPEHGERQQVKRRGRQGADEGMKSHLGPQKVVTRHKTDT